MRFVLDASKVADRQALHRALAEGLRFPAWYGGNLDALYDCLTAISEPVELEICHGEALGSYAEAFRSVLEDSAAENPNLKLIWG